MQVPIQAVSFELVNNKKPLIIEDKVLSCQEFVGTVFAYQHLFSKAVSSRACLSRNHSKWLVIHASNYPIIVQISHPTQVRGRQAYVDVALDSNQLIVVPYGWWCSIPTQATAIAVDDPFSAVISLVKW